MIWSQLCLKRPIETHPKSVCKLQIYVELDFYYFNQTVLKDAFILTMATFVCKQDLRQISSQDTSSLPTKLNILGMSEYFTAAIFKL